MKIDERTPLTDEFLRQDLLFDFRGDRTALLVAAIVTLPALAIFIAVFYWLVIDLPLHIAGRIVFGVVFGGLIVCPFLLFAEWIRDLWKFYRQIRDGAGPPAADSEIRRCAASEIFCCAKCEIRASRG